MPDQIWNLFAELRKEILESQKIRVQVIGFKFTFVSAGIGLMATHLGSIDKSLFVIPALAAICFDFIIYSLSFSIKRIGSYTREYLEPALKKHKHMPEELVLWQQYLMNPITHQRLALYGNLGFTLLTVFLATIALFFPFRLYISTPLLVLLVVFFIMDFLAYSAPKKLGKQWEDDKSIVE